MKFFDYICIFMNMCEALIYKNVIFLCIFIIIFHFVLLSQNNWGWIIYKSQKCISYNSGKPKINEWACLVSGEGPVSISKMVPWKQNSPTEWKSRRVEGKARWGQTSPIIDATVLRIRVEPSWTNYPLKTLPLNTVTIANKF
jgi:hypothetical protein